MKKLFLLIPLFLLSACDSITDAISIPLPPTAREIYEESGGNAINLRFLDPVTPVTVSTIPENGVVTMFYDGVTTLSFELEGGCMYTYDVTDSAGDEAAYWAAQPITLTYDADQVYCGAVLQSCDYSAIMIGSVADVSLVCHSAP